jgi:tetratricopeptide (TPR) repeat protein
VRSERAIEYQNLAFLYDAAGDRVRALEAYRNNRALKLDILRTNPDYRLLKRGLGMASVLVGGALARVGNRDEALSMLDGGIAFYEAVPAGEDEVNTRRELAVSRQKRGDVLLMNGDSDQALRLYRQASDALKPMAAADPQNTMLQLDVASMNYHQGRVLVAQKQYGAAAEKLEQAAAVFEQLHADRSVDDSPRGLGPIYIWLGDATAGRDDWRGALQKYQQATRALKAIAARVPDDDARSELAVGYTKTARALAALGRSSEASSMYRQALEVVLPQASPEHQDVPALYVLADAYAGLGEIAARLSFQEEARTWREKSDSVWRRITNPSRINPLGYLALSHP